MLEVRCLEPWYLNIEPDGGFTVTVPSDVESLADDPACIVAIASIMRLGAKVRTGLPVNGQPGQWQRCHQDVDHFWFGLAAILKDGKVGAYPNYSGWFGKGYNLAAKARLCLEKIAPWSIRGTTTALRTIYLHKGWGEKLPNGYKHLEVLVRKACSFLNLDKEKATEWMKPLSALKGDKLKKGLKLEGNHFLTQTDYDALNLRFKDDIKTYDSLMSNLVHPTWEMFEDLDHQISSTAVRVSSLERTVEKITNRRALTCYPPTQAGIKKRKDSRTLKVRIFDLDLATFINVFGPYDAMGVPHFATSDATAYKADGTINKEELDNQFQLFARQYPAWEVMLMTWWDSEVLSRIQG
jgi:hypothetical protein